MKINTLIYTPYVQNNNFGYQPKYLGKISNYRPVQEVPSMEASVESEVPQVQEDVPLKLPVALPAETPQFQFKQFVPKRGLEGRYAQFVNIYTSAGLPQNELGFWANIAQDESGFTPGIVGENDKYGVEALGYFQMLTKYNNKPMNIAGTYSGVDSQTFLNNPVIQLQAAQNMKNHIMGMFSNKDLEAARAKGYTDSALVAGAWAGGVGGVRKWLHYGKNSVDVNVKDGNNAKRKWECSVAGRMEALNGYFKKGGVLKFAMGGGFEKYIEDNRDHINNVYSRITGLGVGDIGYKDTLMTYRRNAPSQLFASTKDDKTAFSEKHFDNVRRYISDKVDSKKLNNDVLYDIFLDFDKHNIKSLNFNQRQDLIDRVVSTSKKPYLNSLSRHEIFYALEGLYGSADIKKGKFGLKISDPNINEQAADWVSNMNTYMDVEHGTGADFTQWYESLHNSNSPYLDNTWGDNLILYGTYGGNHYVYPAQDFARVNDYYVKDRTYSLEQAIKNKLALQVPSAEVGQYFSKNYKTFFQPQQPSDVLGFKNAKEVYNYILSLPGSNPFIAAGWTGVFMKESGLNHNAKSASGATGIAQLLGNRKNEYISWLSGRPDTWQNQVSWVWDKVNHGKDDWQIYYDALKSKIDKGLSLTQKELHDWNSMSKSKWVNYSFQNYRNRINTMQDPGSIAEMLTWTFERPGEQEADIKKRKEYAIAVYNKFNK